MSSARITSFLVKVASRCNLDCDYCYVYHHADQSWRSMPKLLSAEHQNLFAERLAEHVRTQQLNRVAVIFHGGEPLLAGHQYIVDFTRLLRSSVGPLVEVDVGLQTNGLLLTDDVLDAFEAERIAVSLSMDGPRAAHDLHRTTRKGRSSFDRVEAALHRLAKRPTVFAGVIAVIDASVRPSILLGYFADKGIPKVDFLLPDSHHRRSPPGRDADPGLYERWLVEAFDEWLDNYPELPVRTFEALLDAIAGLPSGTDAFGLGDVSLISLETDGTWHDLDVLKVAGDGATRLVGSVVDTSVEEVASSVQLAAHRRLLTKSGLSATCRSCDLVEICGGGSVPHRFGDGGFDNPTVYCGEMKALIGHARLRLSQSFAAPQSGDNSLPDFDVGNFELAETSAEIVAELQDDALADDEAGLRDAIARSQADVDIADGDTLRRLARRAGTVAWQRATRLGGQVRDIDGKPLDVDPAYVELAASDLTAAGDLEVGRDDQWLRLPFGEGIYFEAEEVAARGRALVDEALSLIDAWRPAVARELRLICSAIQFVRDPSAHPDKIVSFSDDSVPGALFVSIVQGDGLIDAYDLADSLIHEYRHQKLYLFERRRPTTSQGALVVSPWREDLRPVSGLLHAAFVFVELGRFWEHVREHGPPRLHNRATAQLQDTERNLAQAFSTLRDCDLTAAGRALAHVLEERGRPMSLAA
ncbi:MAG: FxsB family radical SAM/SPASM domain protein [Sphingomonas sp.]|uniref:cyclophane-forming radical SAM/SPASM peptide maturase YhhB n=1 Tax=Sphingomonas sp. TaxID=28214 RepID=UPI00121CB9F9|nr:cyclophane-forming radical SAM/SPASM peptide maturase YhhB [Sphingomonas sp.]THD35066.1 MAG: FxsB family radical SAM/SPASM domain protein [Sphingomonas sp.]